MSTRSRSRSTRRSSPSRAIPTRRRPSRRSALSTAAPGSQPPPERSSSSSTPASGSAATASRRSTTSSRGCRSCASGSSRRDRAAVFGLEVMGRVNELGSIDDVIDVAERLPWVRPVIDFAHMHATTDGAFTDVEAFAVSARERGRRARAGCAVPHPLLGHRLREPQRDEAPPVRRRDAPGGAAARRARALRAAGDGDLGIARRSSRRRRFERCSTQARVRARACRSRSRPRTPRPRRRGRGRGGIPPEPAAPPGGSGTAPCPRTISTASRSSASASSSRPCAARTIPSAMRVVEREIVSCGPTVSRASSA